MLPLNSNQPTVAQDVGSVVLSTAVGTGFGYLSGLCGKTNVLASTLIWGAQFFVMKATEVLANRFLGENTRDGKVVKAIGNFLAFTLSTIALRSFDLMGNGGLIVCGVLAIALFAYELREAAKTPVTVMEHIEAGWNSLAQGLAKDLQDVFGL